MCWLKVVCEYLNYLNFFQQYLLGAFRMFHQPQRLDRLMQAGYSSIAKIKGGFSLYCSASGKKRVSPMSLIQKSNIRQLKKEDL